MQAFVSGLELAPGTVRVVVQHLRTVLRSAVRDGLIVRDPSIGVKLPRATTGALVPPTEEDVVAIYEAATPGFRAAVLLGAAVGLRQGEAAGLTVDRVDWRAAPSVSTVSSLRMRAGARRRPGRRSGRSRWPARFSRCSQLTSPRTVPGRGRRRPLARQGPMGHASWAKAMREAVAAAGLDGVRFHDLRHYASKLIAAGCSVKAVQSALGYEKASTTLDTYGHFSPGDDDRIRAAVADAWTTPRVTLTSSEGL